MTSYLTLKTLPAHHSATEWWKKLTAINALGCHLTGMARGSLGCYNIDNSTDAPVLQHSPLHAGFCILLVRPYPAIDHTAQSCILITHHQLTYSVCPSKVNSGSVAIAA